jgi:hypothetical protein
MKQGYCLLLLSLGLVAACSKKEEAASASAPAEPAPTAAAAEAAPAAPAEAAPAAEPKRNWDAVVAEVARIRAMQPMPDAKRTRMLQLQDELMAASNSDPAAREAWANLSRIINGR